MEFAWGRGPAVEVDAYSLNPGLDLLWETQDRPSLSNDPPPQMFAAGRDLPLFVASGEDPNVLHG